MFKKVMFLVFFCLFSFPLFAFDADEFEKSLKDLADQISQTAYAVSERPESAENPAFEGALDRTDKAQKQLSGIINKISNKKDFETAENILNQFAEKSTLRAHSAAIAQKMLKQRANFIFIDEGKEIYSVKNSDKLNLATAPSELLKKRQKRLITIETPIAEAVICVEDTDKLRRVNNLNKIFEAHNCKVISKNTNKKDKKDLYCFYFSGKKYVLDVLLGHYKGSVVNSDLKAFVKITTGGFWSGKKNYTFEIAPAGRNTSVMGELSWYKSVIVEDPTKYLSENHYSDLAKLGSLETVAGKQKLLLKNAVAEISISAKRHSISEAIYFSKKDLGDLYIDAQ
ncbi:MAG: hypothetical protein PHF29_08905 [Candidatus Riflebacteria bacterium]|nr:hypothetical protein [Candidatus Riflebacteria bacterium]